MFWEISIEFSIKNRGLIFSALIPAIDPEFDRFHPVSSPVTADIELRYQKHQMQNVHQVWLASWIFGCANQRHNTEVVYRLSLYKQSFRQTHDRLLHPAVPESYLAVEVSMVLPEAMA